ncbi:MAG: hypothetical protein K1W41_27465 [Lachnospiraceae bacterium]
MPRAYNIFRYTSIQMHTVQAVETKGIKGHHKPRHYNYRPGKVPPRIRKSGDGSSAQFKERLWGSAFLPTVVTLRYIRTACAPGFVSWWSRIRMVVTGMVQGGIDRGGCRCRAYCQSKQL